MGSLVVTYFQIFQLSLIIGIKKYLEIAFYKKNFAVSALANSQEIPRNDPLWLLFRA